MVRVPSVEAEDNRHLHRELAELKRERTRQINRIKGLLIGVGVHQSPRWRRDFPSQLEQMRLWDGSRLPPALRCRLLREHERLECVQHQILELEGDRAELLRECHSPETEVARKMTLLRGVGANGAWLIAMEFFSWRDLRNRRQVGALAGKQRLHQPTATAPAVDSTLLGRVRFLQLLLVCSADIFESAKPKKEDENERQQRQQED